MFMSNHVSLSIMDFWLPRHTSRRLPRPGYWDIHVPPHDSSIYVVEDTMEAQLGCEIDGP